MTSQYVGEDSIWKLPSHHSSLLFSYAATQFSEMGRTQYRCQLIGFNEKWSEWDEKTEKSYTNLPSGKYKFQVQARNDLGAASTVSSFAFQIATPWYLHAAAKMFWVLLGVGFLILGFLLNRKRMTQRADDLLKAKSVEMEKKEAAFQQEIEKNEEQILQLRNEKLKGEIEFKKQELASTTMHLLQKSEILSKLKNELTKLSKQIPDNQRGEVRQIIKTIEQDVKLDENWNSFEHHFDRVHEDFIRRLKDAYPQLTPKDLKLAAYLRMNLVTKEVAPLLNISVRGVEISRYRLRKKLELDREVNLVEYLMNF
jgi:DNA-binding CsgD family transcriptional regulator